MDLPVYLAMTPGEFQGAQALPRHTGWMSCHFSAFTSGLSGLPRQLPEGSILILDDALPMAEHDSNRIAEELAQFLNTNTIDGLLLDFQREPTRQAHLLAEQLTSLPCPVAMPEAYAANRSCAVFLPPCPGYVPLGEYVKKWDGRSIWLEIALSSHQLILTETGCQIEERSFDFAPAYEDEKLCCHYDMTLEADRAIFHLCRTRDDLQSLLTQAQGLGICKAVGLYQELGTQM